MEHLVAIFRGRDGDLLALICDQQFGVEAPVLNYIVVSQNRSAGGIFFSQF